MSNPNVAADAAAVKTLYADIQHAGGRLKAAIPELDYTRRVKEVLKGRKLKDVSAAEYPAMLVNLRLALATHLVETFGPIFPLNAELKDPWCTNGHKDATSDLKQIERWVREKPNCNWGGCINGAVDVDTSEAHGKDGLGNWIKLLIEYNDGNEPDTLRLKTPTGGLHYPLTTKHPKRDLRPGVELPNYIVLPGSHVTANGKSVKVTGFYKPDNALPINGVPFIGKLVELKQVETVANDNGAPASDIDSNAAIAQATAMLKDFARSKVTRDKNGLQYNGPAIEGDYGDNWTVQVAMKVGDLGVSCETCLDLMDEHFNSACIPPWSFDGNQSLRTKVESAYKSRQSAIGAGSAQADFEDDPVDETIDAPHRRDRLKARSFAELEGLPDPKFVVANMVPDDALTVVYGKPKRGKSIWALELSLCMATGTPFFGETLGRTGRVIYVAAEGGAAAVRNRVRAWCKARKVDPKLLDGTWLLVDTAVLLNSRSSIQNFLALNPGDYAMTFIDTLARCMNGDENSAKDMGAAIKGCDFIREQVCGGVLIVHHEGWSAKRIRGSSVLQGAPDAVIRVARDNGNVTTVVAEDMRESAAGRRQDFILSNGVLSMLSAEETTARQTGDRAIDILATLQTENEGEPVPLDRWREMVRAAGLIDADKSKSTGRTALLRLIEKAVAAKRIKVHKGERYTVNVNRDALNDDATVEDFEDVE